MFRIAWLQDPLNDCWHADGNNMRLDDYISVTSTPGNSPVTSASSLLGTVYPEAAFLEAFAPQDNQSNHQHQQKQLLPLALLDPGTTSTAWQH